MASVDWPSGLRGALAEGYALEPAANVLRSEMDQAAKQRVERTGAPRRVQVRYRWTNAEFATWRTWFEGAAEEGAQRFNWVEPVSGDAVEARIVGGAAGYQLSDVRAGRVTVALELELFG